MVCQFHAWKAHDQVSTHKLGTYKCNSLTEPQCFHNCGEEVLKSIGREVEILHQCKDPGAWVYCCLTKSFPRRDFFAITAHNIPLNPFMCKNTFLLGQPPCG